MKRWIAVLTTVAIAWAGSPAPATSRFPPTPRPTLAPTAAPSVRAVYRARPAAAGPTPQVTPDSSAASQRTAASHLAAPAAPVAVVPCPLTGRNVAPGVLAERRPLLVQIGNSSAERPQFGLAQADLVFETIAEGGITRLSAIYLCQDAEEIANVRSGRLVDVHLVSMFDAVFVHAGASQQVKDLFLENARIRDSSLDYFYYHPGFVRQPDRRYTPFDIFTSTAALWAAARDSTPEQLYRETPIEVPGRPPPALNFSGAPPAGGTPVSAVTVRHHSSYWVRWKWDQAERAWTRHISSAANSDGDAPHVDAATGRTLTAQNVVIVQAAHHQTDIVEDRNGHFSIAVDLLGSGAARLLRDGRLYEGMWQRLAMADWFTLTLRDGTPYAFEPGNSYVHIYPASFDLGVVPRERLEAEVETVGPAALR